jgi:PPOX class probable F420-dependent enzyme
VDTVAALEFIRGHHQAVLLTYRRDGAPQLSPIACNVDADGRVVVSTRETALKTKNLRRDPRVSLCVLTDGFYGEWIQVDGTADVVSLPDAMEPLVDYYRSTAGEHPDWDDYRAAMVREQRVIVRITVERAGPDRSG